jgi:nucleotide-binding universal stress UspA family protein
MLQIRRILFPTDRSACAEQAYVHAAFLARAVGADFHALAVRDPKSPAPATTDLLPLSSSDVARELHIPVERMPADLDPDRVHQANFASDSPADGILQYAEEEGIDLIVMGTHGRQAADRLMAGSVAERVVREAPCPVMTVRCARSVEVNRVLVPIDFSDRSKAVIPVARELARLYGAEVELFFVIDEDTMPMAHVPLLGPVHVSPEEVEKRFRKLMRQLVESHQSADVPVSGTVHIGHPTQDITEYATDHADLIVMGTHGRTGLQRLFLGSVAEKVVRHAPCPVFTVKSFGQPLLEESRASEADASDA